MLVGTCCGPCRNLFEGEGKPWGEQTGGSCLNTVMASSYSVVSSENLPFSTQVRIWSPVRPLKPALRHPNHLLRLFLRPQRLVLFSQVIFKVLKK